MANGDDFKGRSPWGSSSGGGNGSSRGGQRPPNIDEVIEKIQNLINKLIPGGKSGGSKPIIFGLILLVIVALIATKEWFDIFEYGIMLPYPLLLYNGNL